MNSSLRILALFALPSTALTQAPCALLADLNPGTGHSVPQYLTRMFGNSILFEAETPSLGAETYIWNDAQSLQLLTETRPGPLGGNPSRYTECDLPQGRRVFFAAAGTNMGSTTGEELWITDGTAAGTNQVTEIAPGIRSAVLGEFTPFHQRLFFAANDSQTGQELWVSDGTALGTQLFFDLNPGRSSSYPTSLVALPDRIVFGAYSPATGRELWSTDGVSTSLVRDFAPRSRELQHRLPHRPRGPRVLRRLRRRDRDRTLENRWNPQRHKHRQRHRPRPREFGARLSRILQRAPLLQRESTWRIGASLDFRRHRKWHPVTRSDIWATAPPLHRGIRQGLLLGLRWVDRNRGLRHRRHAGGQPSRQELGDVDTLKHPGRFLRGRRRRVLLGGHGERERAVVLGRNGFWHLRALRPQPRDRLIRPPRLHLRGRQRPLLGEDRSDRVRDFPHRPPRCNRGVPVRKQPPFTPGTAHPRQPAPHSRSEHHLRSDRTREPHRISHPRPLSIAAAAALARPHHRRHRLGGSAPPRIGHRRQQRSPGRCNSQRRYPTWPASMEASPTSRPSGSIRVARRSSKPRTESISNWV